MLYELGGRRLGLGWGFVDKLPEFAGLPLLLGLAGEVHHRALEEDAAALVLALLGGLGYVHIQSVGVAQGGLGLGGAGPLMLCQFRVELVLGHQ